MIWLTQFGKEVFWIAAAILLFAFGGIVGKKTAILIIVAIIVLIPMGFAAKEIIARPRPIIPESDLLLSADSQYAFPSGHALMVSAGATITLVLFRGSKSKLIVSPTLASEAGLVCFSRVYVGGHYPLDVLGGILLGIAVAHILTRFEKKLEPLHIIQVGSRKNAWTKRSRTSPFNNNTNSSTDKNKR